MQPDSIAQWQHTHIFDRTRYVLRKADINRHHHHRLDDGCRNCHRFDIWIDGAIC
jgi:hypothetical protein